MALKVWSNAINTYHCLGLSSVISTYYGTYTYVNYSERTDSRIEEMR